MFEEEFYNSIQVDASDNPGQTVLLLNLPIPWLQLATKYPLLAPTGRVIHIVCSYQFVVFFQNMKLGISTRIFKFTQY